MFKYFAHSFALLLLLTGLWGCSAYQPTKNVWKTTKGLWNTYVSPAAAVDYEEKGSLSAAAKALSLSMLGVDKELGRLERMMQNADKPPTKQWLSNFLQAFPWVNGFVGVKYDGTILGQEPPDSLKELDFNGLLYEDKKQNSRALRADVQPSPLGPEIMLAAPLYDGVDFLGIVVTYFDMRSLMQFAQNPEDMVILCPSALLWPGKYDFAATPLAGTNWNEVVTKSTAGTCTNANGSFFYMVRYLGNLPLIFAIPEKGDFPQGNGNLEQGFAIFPAGREKLPPPPLPERKPESKNKYDSFGLSGEPEEETSGSATQAAESVPEAEQPPHGQPERTRPSDNEIEPGNRDSLLLKEEKQTRKGQVRERSLNGENIVLEPAPGPKAPLGSQKPALNLIPDDDAARLPDGRPSPFGPRSDGSTPAGRADSASSEPPTESGANNSSRQTEEEMDDRFAAGKAVLPEKETKSEGVPHKTSEDSEEKASSPLSDTKPEKGINSGTPLLPGGRPSPFGPKD